jgi:ectoine hydroxylase-related dioxygenase (phytanoyl-CoA dioxygenase family)
LDEYEKYFFDLNGYLVVENALSTEELGTLNEAIDNNADRIKIRSAEQTLAKGSPALVGEHGRGDLGGMLTWPKPSCEPFRALLDHPSIMPHLLEVLRDGFRLDHLYGIITVVGAEGHTLHGGGTADDFTHFYQFHNGRMRCGLTVVSWALTDVGPGDGGFMCIPGSHKSNYVSPPGVSRLEKDIGVVRQVEAPAGSAVIFTEALTHGTMPWKAKRERRSILYKYSPGPLTYGKRYIPEGVEDTIDEFTPSQRAMLEPPYRAGRPSIVEAQ